eukprot:SAG31_NODE_6939_length_1843_cov_1.291858_1_plen_410_part_10
MSSVGKRKISRKVPSRSPSPANAPHQAGHQRPLQPGLKLAKKVIAISFIVACASSLLAECLQSRDDNVVLRNPRPPVPPHGRVTTIKLHQDAVAKVAGKSSVPAAAFAQSFDMYYEADLTGSGCDPKRSENNFVLLSGTNGQSFLYWPLLERMQGYGYCTLVFDYRAHGRSEVAPGAYTTELFGEDAATIIHKIFSKRVHLFGWSIGGAAAYYLALEYPDMVASLTVLGMTSCFGRRVLPAEDGACDDSWSSMLTRPLSIQGVAAQPLFYWQSLLRLQGTELLGWFASQPSLFNHQTTPEVMRYHHSLRTEALARTFQAWPRWNYTYYQEAIKQISQPALLLAGELEDRLGFGPAELDEDCHRLPGCKEAVILPGFSHLVLLETRNGRAGYDVIAAYLEGFYDGLALASA